MSALIVLRHLCVENANAIAGLTWGFPGITHFLGFTHALSRQLSQTHGVTLDGCGVVCHQQQVHAQSSGRDYVFSLTRNPLTRDAKTAAFNEEGRMHMTVSLLMRCNGMISDGEQGAAALATHITTLCQRLRLAGGTVTSVGQVQVLGWPEEERQVRRVLRRLLPGFALLDRSPLLDAHFSHLQQTQPDVEMIDAWLDFSSIKMQAVVNDAEPAEPAEPAGPVNWEYQPKPAPGFLVPLMTGYQAISPVYEPGAVANSRDTQTPFCFTEAVYGIGEWRGLHRIDDLRELFWQHHYDDGNYLCRSEKTASVQSYPEYDEEINYD